MDNTITLSTDGRGISAVPGQTVLEAALTADVYIPYLCVHPDLTPVGGCGLCVADISGLTAAFYLNKQGHGVTVFEKRPVPGGYMTGGIPEYRLPTADVLAQIFTAIDVLLTPWEHSCEWVG